MDEHAPPMIPTGGRLPPQDIKAERAVLGSILQTNEAADVAQGIVKPQDFYVPAHQLVYQAMLDLWDRSSAVDMVTLQSELTAKGISEKVGGPALLVELAASVPTAANVKHYSEIVRSKACLLYTSPSPRDVEESRMPSSA